MKNHSLKFYEQQTVNVIILLRNKKLLLKSQTGIDGVVLYSYSFDKFYYIDISLTIENSYSFDFILQKYVLLPKFENKKNVIYFFHNHYILQDNTFSISNCFINFNSRFTNLFDILKI